ncbi:MAG: hypothetical protein IJ737_01145 [Ruminococcus sp.]|nr:hypothetical protein [Ruminococcus sp.]
MSDEEYIKQYITDYVSTLQEHYPEIESADEELVINNGYYTDSLAVSKVVTILTDWEKRNKD